MGRRQRWERQMALQEVSDDRVGEVLARVASRQALLDDAPFPVYCLDESWPGSRVRSGGSFAGGFRAGLHAMRGDWSRLNVTAVHVDHVLPGGQSVRVTSMPRRWSTGRRARKAMLGHLLHRPTFRERGSTSGDAFPPDGAAAKQLDTGSPPHDEEIEAPALRWRPSQLTLEGQSIPCEVAELDGRWAVLAETEDVALMVVGRGLPLLDIALVPLADHLAR